MPEKQDIAPIPPPPAKASIAGVPVKDLPKKWAGNWLYFPNPTEPNKAQYVAEYIELALTDQDGMLNGTYWSRYRVTDQAISPEVRFRLEGRSTDTNTLNLHWISADGAEGESQLILDTSDTMTLNWWTVHFGTKPGLSSGTARLVRQRR
jgi:hypothetical protein